MSLGLEALTQKIDRNRLKGRRCVSQRAAQVRKQLGLKVGFGERRYSDVLGRQTRRKSAEAQMLRREL